jgi:hypothetical protein
MMPKYIKISQGRSRLTFQNDISNNIFDEKELFIQNKKLNYSSFNQIREFHPIRHKILTSYSQNLAQVKNTPPRGIRTLKSVQETQKKQRQEAQKKQRKERQDQNRLQKKQQKQQKHSPDMMSTSTSPSPSQSPTPSSTNQVIFCF